MSNNIDKGTYKSGFIAFIGRPNCGKSTLLNTILEENLAIATALPQTTRSNMRGIYTEKNLQLVFLDTPGIHKGKHKLNKSMYEQAVNTLQDEGIDIITYIVDLTRSSGEEEDGIAQLVEKVKATVCILFNKEDLCKDVEKVKQEFYQRYPALEKYPSLVLSAVSKEAKDQFLTHIHKYLYEGPQYYPTDDITDSNLRYFASEYIRKQIIHCTREEVPHACCVEILDYKEFEKKHVVEAVIHVETQGQKGIIIGKRGSVISAIKSKAKKELAELVQVPVTLNCHVKVSPRWRDNKQFLKEMGLE